MKKRKSFLTMLLFVFAIVLFGVSNSFASEIVHAVKVRKGQSLYSIARAYRMSWKDLFRHNGLESSVIFPGQKIKVLVKSRQLVVKASWYGPKFHGRRTANGEIYDMFKLTAAHKYLPLGTLIRASYKEKSVIVRINDRGPYIAGRELDLSFGAAKALGLIEKGVAKVRIEILF